MSEIASGFVSLVPSARGFGSKLDREVGRELDASGKRAGGRFGVAMKTGLLAGGAAAVGIIGSAVKLEATFSKTMNVLQATTGESGKGMKTLSALALKMGADTVFSANDASQAMLELARGGISSAQIQAGALEGTLTLAAAGELEMGEAANIAVKSMGQFNLEGKDMGSIAAALAGAANASSASVRDMSIALAQGGLAANSVGFSIQETGGILAAFSNAGLEGSDAGTSLKTTLDRLQPATEKQSVALGKLGAITKDGTNLFVKANGEFKSAAQIAGVLQKGTVGLDQAERKRLITQAFGSDAQRGATILAKEGANGIRELVKATSDQDAAQNLAAATMKGTAGAIEQFKGSVETAALKFGLFISPAVQGSLGLLTRGINNLGPAFNAVGAFVAPVVTQVKAFFTSLGGGGGLDSLRATLTSLGQTITASLLPVLQAAATTFKTVVLPAVLAVGQYLVTNFVPIFQTVGQIIVGQVIPIVGKLATFFYGTLYPALIAIVTAVATKLKPVFDQLIATFRGSVQPTVQKLLAQFEQYRPTIQKVISAVVAVAGAVLTFAAAVLGKVLPPVIKFAGFLISNLVPAIASAIGVLIKIAGFVVDVGAKFIDGAKKIGQFAQAVQSKVDAAVGFVREIPGKVTAVFSGAATLLINAGSQLMSGLASGIRGKIDDAINEVKAGLSKIRDLLPGSPIKDGPLKGWNGGTPGKKLMELLARGMKIGSKAVQAEMTSVLEKLQSQLDKSKSKLSTLASDFTSLSGSVASAFTGNLFEAGTASDFLTNLTSTKGTLGGITAAFKKLTGLGFAPGFLAQLFQSGNAPLILDLAAAGNEGLASESAALFGGIQTMSSNLGDSVAKSVLGDKMTDVRNEIRELRKDVRQLAPNISKGVSDGVNGATVNGHRQGQRR